MGIRGIDQHNAEGGKHGGTLILSRSHREPGQLLVTLRNFFVFYEPDTILAAFAGCLLMFIFACSHYCT